MNTKLLEKVFHAIVIFVFVVGTVWTPGISAIAQALCPSSMVGYWKGDGDATDIIGFNNGQVQGGVQYVPGKVGQAFSFDGVDDSVEFPNSPNLVLGSDDFTLMAWVYPTAYVGSGGLNAIITKHSADEGSWLFRIASDLDGIPRINFETGYPTSRYYGNTEITLNAWHHVAVKRNANNYTFYVDGHEDGTFYDEKVFTTQEPIRISGQGNAFNERWAGMIDEIALYNDALPTQEIQQYYQNGLNGQSYCEQTQSNQPPIADASGPYTGFAGDSITLDASASSDPEAGALTFEWDLNNDGEYDDATGMTTTTVFNQVGEYTVGLRVTDTLGLTGTDTAVVTVSEQLPDQPTPRFSVWMPNSVHGYEWPIGIPVTLTVAHPETPDSPYYTDIQTPDIAPWGANNTWVVFSLPSPLIIETGDIVTMTDGVTTKAHTVEYASITGANPENDTVSGTADPNVEVQVTVQDAFGAFQNVSRIVMSDSNGNWSADFSVPGALPDEQAIVDIVGGTYGYVNRGDNDGDNTTVKWRVLEPVMLQPVIWAHPNDSGEDWIDAREWNFGETIQLTIDNDTDPSNGTLYTDSGVVGPANWNPSVGVKEFHLGNFDLKPGHIVTLTGATTTKVLVITDINVTDINPDLDTISGTAVAGSAVQAWFHEEHTCNYEIFADENGSWTVDFKPCDLRPTVGGGVGQVDADQDSTVYFWRVPNPNFQVRANEDRVKAIQWPMGDTLTLTIDDPATTENPDYTTTRTVSGTADWDPNQTYVSFDLADIYDIQPGDTVTVSNGSITKTTVVTNLAITNVDLNTDTVYGIAEPNQTVNVWTCWQGNPCINRETSADQDGDWATNFSVPGEQDWEQETADLQAGSWIDSSVNDEDGDSTMFSWRVPTPRFSVWMPNSVHGYEWPLGVPVTLTIAHPNTPALPYYTDIQSPIVAPWSAQSTWVGFNLPDPLVIEIGDIVTMTNGITMKNHIVRYAAITNVNPENDTVSGTADPNVEVQVTVQDAFGAFQNVSRYVMSDSNGNWSADFSTPGTRPDEQDIVDIVAGTYGFINRSDNDEDYTTYKWRMPNPTIQARANDNRIEGYEWPLNATVNFEIEDPATPQNPDYSDSATVGVADWDPNQTWFGIDLNNYDLKTGDIVTATDGNSTKQLVVSNFMITDVDLDLDIVYGIAESNQLVNIWTCWESDPCINRDETADQNGDWSTNFSVPGEQNWEQETADLRVGSWIDSSVNDEDGDSTMFGLTVEPPPPPQCQPGNTVSGAVYEHDGVTPIPSVTIQIEDYTTGDILFTTNADQNGQFACSLPDGDYRIHALADNYSQEYFDEAVDTNAALVQVTTGTQLANINFTLSRLPTMEHLTFNLDNALLQDLVVRQAISLGTNRQRILSEAFLPNGTFGLVSNSIVPPEHWAAAPASELTIYSFDPVQAGAILDAAGWINRDADVFRENAGGVELAFTFKTTPALTRVVSAEIFRQNMEQIGIRITVEHIQPSELFGVDGVGGVLDQGNYDIAEFAWGGSYDNETYLEPYITGNISNLSGYSNPLFDAAMANAAAASNDAVRLPYLFEAQAILTQDLPIFPLFTRQNVAPVTTPTGSNVTVSPETYLNVHFDEVTQAGVTTVLPANINPDDLPPNFQLLGQVYYVGTSATFTSAQVCFTYDDAGLTPAQESAIRLLHLENNAWVDVTDSGYPNTVNNMVCGTVTSFSPFAIMYALNQPPVANAGPDRDVYVGDTITLDASASADPEAGSLTYEWDLDNDGQFDDANGVTATTSFNQIGDHTIGLRVTDDGGLTDTDSATVTVLPWTLKGFYQPVDMNGVYNIVKGGSTVPFKFEIFAGSTELTNVADIKSLTYAQTTCNANAITDEIETTATGGTSLRYDPMAGQFIYNWKTPNTPGKCYRVTMITMDGASLLAYFKLK